MIKSLLHKMAEYNIYSTYSFSYNFGLGDAYVTKTGFSNVIDSDIFEFKTPMALTAISIIIKLQQTQSGTQIHAMCLDDTNNPIPGSEEIVMTDPAIKSIYTFSNQVPKGATLRFKISSTLTTQRNIEFCNISITTS